MNTESRFWLWTAPGGWAVEATWCHKVVVDLVRVLAEDSHFQWQLSPIAYLQVPVKLSPLGCLVKALQQLWQVDGRLPVLIQSQYIYISVAKKSHETPMKSHGNHQFVSWDLCFWPNPSTILRTPTCRLHAWWPYWPLHGPQRHRNRRWCCHGTCAGALIYSWDILIGDIWVWVKMRYPYHWMVNTKLD